MENVTLSRVQSEFLKRARKGENIFLTGKAGTGKSFVVKTAIQWFQDNGKKIVALAPTGVAANNIKGQTIHSFFSINPFGIQDFDNCKFIKGEKRRMMQAIDVIFVDEVSMLRPDILDAMHWTMIKNGIAGGLTTKQLVFVGDLKQLPSPMSDNEKSMLLQQYPGTLFTDAQVYKKLNVKTIELDEILRQSDPEFIEALNLVREGQKAPYFRKFINEHTKGIILAPHNSTVSRYNEIGLRKIDKEEIVLKASVTGNAKASEFNLESEIRVKDGATIMYLVNSKENNLVNGTIGTFRDTPKGYFIEVGQVQYALMPFIVTKIEYVFNEEKDVLELKEIGSMSQYPFKLAYALTIHKSQGLTFDSVTVDLSVPCFSEGQLYTALSRVTGPDGLTIIAK